MLATILASSRPEKPSVAAAASSSSAASMPRSSMRSGDPPRPVIHARSRAAKLSRVPAPAPPAAA